MKICIPTAYIALILLVCAYSAEDVQDEQAMITFRAVTDPLTRKVRIERESIPQKSAAEKELDAEQSLIPNVQIDESGKPSYMPSNAQKFDIKDVDRLDDDIMAYLKVIKYDVLLNLRTSIKQTAIEHSYLIYKNLTRIVDTYFMRKPILRAKVTRLRDITSFALQYAKDASVAQMKQLITAADVELDEYNKKMLIALLERLDAQAEKIWESTYIELEELMQETDRIREDPQMTASNKLSKLIESSFKLAIFQQEIVEDGTYQMKGLVSLIVDNPKYHHLTQGFSAVLKIKAKACIMNLLIASLTLLLIWT